MHRCYLLEGMAAAGSSTSNTLNGGAKQRGQATAQPQHCGVVKLVSFVGKT